MEEKKKVLSGFTFDLVTISSTFWNNKQEISLKPLDYI